MDIKSQLNDSTKKTDKYVTLKDELTNPQILKGICEELPKEANRNNLPQKVKDKIKEIMKG